MSFPVLPVHEVFEVQLVGEERAEGAYLALYCSSPDAAAVTVRCRDLTNLYKAYAQICESCLVHFAPEKLPCHKDDTPAEERRMALEAFKTKAVLDRLHHVLRIESGSDCTREFKEISALHDTITANFNSCLRNDGRPLKNSGLPAFSEKIIRVPRMAHPR